MSAASAGMNKDDDDRLLSFVPTSQGTAMLPREIWIMYGLWSSVSIRNRLTVMHRKGIVNRAARLIPNGNCGFVYWRNA